MVWSDITTANELVQQIALKWKDNLPLSGRCHKSLTDKDGTIVVLYYVRAEDHLSYTRLSRPRND